MIFRMFLSLFVKNEYHQRVFPEKKRERESNYTLDLMKLIHSRSALAIYQTTGASTAHDIYKR